MFKIYYVLSIIYPIIWDCKITTFFPHREDYFLFRGKKKVKISDKYCISACCNIKNIYKKFATPISFQQFTHLLFRQILVFYSVLYTSLFILSVLKRRLH